MSDLVAALERARSDLPLFAKTCLWIRDKGGRSRPLLFNGAQKYIHEQIEKMRAETGKVRVVILKGRQQGCSTYVQARAYWRTALRPGVQALIMAHEQAASDHLFGMAQRFHDRMPEIMRPSTSAANARELVFGAIDSGYKVTTAGTRAVGRSSTLQFAHLSEFAFWPMAEEHMAGIGQAVADLPGTEVIVESTAKGCGTAFHKLWQAAVAGESDYRPIFVPWYWQDEYQREVQTFTRTAQEDDLAQAYGLTDAQLAWRRAKIKSDFGGDEVKFLEEYPSTPEEAFQAERREVFISMADIAAARRYMLPEPVSAPVVIGVDPARFGEDRTAVVIRRGRVVERVLAKQGLDTMQVSGMVVNLIQQYRPAAVFVDSVGLGAGVLDRLRELGYEQVLGVQFGDAAQDPDRWRNRRAECWGRMRDWFRTRVVRIPDSDALAQDLTAPGFSYTSRGQVQLESKDDIRKRGGASPDLADALALTFAEFVSEDRVDESRRLAQMADAVGY